MSRRRRRNPSWFKEHPWMTYFLAGSIIGLPASIITAMAFAKKLNAPPPPPPSPFPPPFPPFHAPQPTVPPPGAMPMMRV